MIDLVSLSSLSSSFSKMEVINFTIGKSGHNNIKMAFDLSDTNKNILNKVCEQFKVSPEDYELRYGNKLLGKDFEVSDLPPEAHLELHPCPCTSDQSVLVELLIGNNVTSKKFKCSASLWKVSQDLLPKDRFIEDDRIQISYYGKTVVGSEKLKKIQLSSLYQNDGKITLKLDRNYSDEDVISKQQKAGSSVDSKLLQSLKSEVKGHEKHKKSSNTSKTEGKKYPGYRSSVTVKALTNIDKTIYTNSTEKLKGVRQLDERKGLLYNMKNLPTIGKAGSDLLGLNNDRYGSSIGTSSTGSEKDIPMKIIFPDQSVIQASFNGEETVGEISRFLATILKCPTSNIILYTKDPKCDLDVKRTLKDISGLPENTLYLRAPTDVPKHSAFPALKDIWEPKSQVKLKSPPKRWSISTKKR